MQDKMQGLFEHLKSKINEEDTGMIPQEEVENEAPPEVTPELAAELAATVGVEDVEQFSKGLQCSLAYYDAVAKQLDVLAKIVAVNIGKIPDYYSRLEAMEAAYEAEKAAESEGGEGEEEVVGEEPVAKIDNEEIVAEESRTPIDSKPAAATAITSETKKSVKEGKLDYSSIDTGDTDKNLKALTEKLALAEQKIEELNSLLAKGRGDEEPLGAKPKVDTAISKLASGSLGKEVVDKGEVSVKSHAVAAKDGKGLEKEKNIEKIGAKPDLQNAV